MTTTTAPLPQMLLCLMRGTQLGRSTVQYSTVQYHLFGWHLRQKRVANCMPRYSLSLKECLVSINKGMSGPQIQSRHSGENFQASPGDQSWNLIYSQQTYFPILHYFQMSTTTNPEVSTTEPNSSNVPLNTLLRKITLVYPVNYKIFLYIHLYKLPFLPSQFQQHNV